jgi:Protein of unknown function (DUF3592)
LSTAIVTLIAAVVASVIGVGTFFNFFLGPRRWPRASGRVVGNVAERRSRGRGYAHFPRIAFRAGDGRDYEVRGDIGRSDEWPLGQQVTLRYRASDPRQTTLLAGWQRLLFSAVFLGLAVACWYAWLEMAAG